MRAVAYRLRCTMRKRWVTAMSLCLVIAAVFGVVLAFAAGAERTSTVADRYTAARGRNFDGLIYQQEGRPRTAEIAALPGAATVQSATFVFGAMFKAGSKDNVDTSTFAGSYRPTGNQLVSGREPNPAVAGEFVATRTFMKNNHAAIGDTFDVETLDQAQADAAGYGTAEAPAGPRLTGVLVGVVDGPSSLDGSSPAVVFSPAFLDDPRVGVKVTLISVGLAPGVDLATFRAALDTLPNSGSLSLQQEVLVSPAVRKAADAQALGLWALTAVAAVAAVAVLAQLITRHVRLSDTERSRLSSIGYAERQIVGESMARAALPVVTGALLGVVAAVALSGVFPTGFARRIEPHPGVRIDPPVLLLGAALCVVALMACTLAALLISTLDSRRGARQTVPLAALATRAGSATASTGLRFAFGRRDEDRGSTRAVLIGLAVTVACLVGAVTFGASLRRLVDQPPRYGVNYDLMLGNSGGDTVPEGLLSAVESDADVAAVLLYAEGQARVGPATLRLVGMQPVKGDVAPEILAGRLPTRPDEIALGRLAAAALHVRIGDQLSLTGDNGPRSFNVTGLAVVPSIGLNDGIGQDGLLTIDALTTLNPTVTPVAAAIKLRPDAPAEAAARLARASGVPEEQIAAGPSTGTPPAAIVNVARVRSIPFVLAALLAVLAVLTVGHVMVTSIQNRRRDVAILRSLGADRRWIGRAIHWQATAFTLLPVAVGVPVGLIMGKIAFRSFADSIGTLNGASTPLVIVAAMAIGLLAFANVAAGFPARRADRVAPAVLLRPE